VIEWTTLIPIITKIVAPRVLDAISYRLKGTPEAEKARLEKMLSSLSDEVFSLIPEAKRKSKRETVEKLRKLWDKVYSQEYQKTLGPPVAGVVMRVLGKAITGKKSAIPRILEELRKLINTWVHNLRFRDTIPSV